MLVRFEGSLDPAAAGYLELASSAAGAGPRGVECVSPVYLGPRGEERLFHRDEAVFRFRPPAGDGDEERVLFRLGAQVLRRPRGGKFLSVRLPPGLSLARALSILLEDPAVLLAEPRYLAAFRPEAEPACGPVVADDPLLGEEWAFQNLGGSPCFKAGADIDLFGAWRITCGSPEVVIAVVDSGMDLEHPDLRGQLYPRGDEDWNFTLEGPRAPADGIGHGTSVAGLAAAAVGNGTGMAGVAPGCRLMPLKIDGLDLVTNLVSALDYLVQFSGAHPELRFVVNGSLSTGVDSQAVHLAVASAREAGLVLCFAAGNGGGEVEAPASYPEAIAVGAIGPDGARKRRDSCSGGAWASSHGPELDLVAPGVDLVTTDITGPGGRVPGDYDHGFSGTSGACPLVAGVAALVLSAAPRLTPRDVARILETTAVDGQGDPREDTPGFDEFMGWGRVDAMAAVRQAALEGQAQRGDFDCNLIRDLADVVGILATLFEGAPPGCPAAGDVNADQRLDITDPIYLVQWLFQGGPPPPP
jgi:hypothetical protein